MSTEVQNTTSSQHDAKLPVSRSSIRVYCGISTGEIEEWLNSLDNVQYDSIKLGCHSCDNSGSGVMFTVVVNCG